MPFNLNVLPNEQNVREAIQQGEGAQIEIRESVTSGLDLAKLVSGFANTSGGWVIVGVRPPNVVVGVDAARLNEFFDRVNQRTKPAQNLMMYPVTLNGRDVRVVVVKPANQLVLTDAGAFRRDGTQTVPMTQDQVLAKMPQPVQPPQQTREESASDIARLTESMNDLMAKFDASQRWSGQGKNLIVGTLGSTLSTILVAVVLLIVGVVVGWFAK